MTLDQFVANPPVGYNNQPIDVDKQYGDQCWDLVEQYAEDVLLVPKEPWAITLGPEGAAKEAWTVFDAHMQRHFDKIPAAQRQRGDINVYGPHGAYTEGHIAVELGNGWVFEQNADPDGSWSHSYQRNSTYILGSLRSKGADMYDGQTAKQWHDQLATANQDLENATRAANARLLTPGEVDKIFKMGLRRDPTAQELGNPAYQTDPRLCVNTVWNNGGEQFFDNPSEAEQKIAQIKKIAG